MTLDLLATLAAFAFATSITPGPNNFMLMASGAQFGLVRTLPHLLGVSLGFAVVAIAVGLGLGGLLAQAPAVQTALKAICAGFLLWIAWRIATADSSAAHVREGRGRPLSFAEAALFQWINPKVWPMALTAMTLYAPSRAPSEVALAAGVFSLVNLPCVGLWAVAGRSLQKWLSVGRRRRIFNYAMAAVLLLSIAPILAA